MSHNRALAFAVGSFVFFAVLVVLLFVALDVDMLFLAAPLVAVGFACAGVYKSARSG